MRYELEREWADSHGYAAFRCPVCKKSFYSDSAPECPNGCDQRKREAIVAIARQSEEQGNYDTFVPPEVGVRYELERERADD